MSKIICGLATISGREEALKDTVLSIIDQVDKLIIYQNGYKEIFDFLDNGKIEVYSSIDTGVDMGDAGKYYKVSEYTNHYYFSIDDDLIYPTDYVKNMVDSLKKYNDKTIVSHHGRILNIDAKSYYKDSKIKHKCLDDVYNCEFVHFGGTGVMAFHTRFVKLKFEYFKTPNMADIWVGLFGRENNIPILVLPHKAGWIKYTNKIDDNKTIYSTHVNNSTIQDSLITNFDKRKIVTMSKVEINYKICFLIPSYNRYDKLIKLLEQINNETTANVIVYDDTSTDERYLDIEKVFNNVKVIRGSKNNGKSNYQNTMFRLFDEAIRSNYDYFTLIADDFILCKSFESVIAPYLNEYYITNVFSIRPEGWGRFGWVDGAFSASKNGLALIKSIIPKVLIDVEGKSTGVWRKVTDYFTTVNRTNYRLISLNYSLTQHDGNDDSKLHPIHRLKNPIIAHNFYDTYYGEEIKIAGESKFIGDIKKKSSGGTSNGNKNTTPTPEPKIQEQPKPPTRPIINTPIAIQKPNIQKPEPPKNMQTPKVMNKTHEDLFMGKSMKKNLRFGKR